LARQPKPAAKPAPKTPRKIVVLISIETCTPA
jgi:hypothetical protein